MDARKFPLPELTPDNVEDVVRALVNRERARSGELPNYVPPASGVGAPGAEGPQGPPGLPGAKGDKGDTGAPGRDAPSTDVTSLNPPEDVNVKFGLKLIVVVWKSERFVAQIWRSTGNFADGALVHQGSTGGLFVDEDVNLGIEYYYWIRFVWTNSDATIVYSDWAYAGSAIPSGVDTVDIADYSITRDKLVDEIIDELKLAPDSVTRSRIKDGEVTAVKIPDQEIIGRLLKDGAVTSVKIGDLEVKPGNIDIGAITGDKIKDGAVTSVKIGDLEVKPGNIDIGAITGDKIKDGAVTSVKIGDLEVKPGNIDIGAVTGDKIKYHAITNDKIAFGAVKTHKLANRAVIVDKLAANAVISDKIAANAVTAGKIAASAVVADKIAANAVISDKIAANAVIAGKIAASAVVADKIAANAVISDKIAANAVIAGKIAASAVEADAIAAGAVVAGKIAANVITGHEIAANVITSQHIISNNILARHLVSEAVTADKLAANSVEADKLAANSVTARTIAATDVAFDNATINDGTILFLTANRGQMNALTISDFLQSSNYAAGHQGWKINRLGQAEFHDAYVRGNIEATTLKVDRADIVSTLNLQGNAVTSSRAWPRGTAEESDRLFRFSDVSEIVQEGGNYRRRLKAGQDFNYHADFLVHDLDAGGDIRDVILFARFNYSLFQIFDEPAIEGFRLSSDRVLVQPFAIYVRAAAVINGAETFLSDWERVDWRRIGPVPGGGTYDDQINHLLVGYYVQRRSYIPGLGLSSTWIEATREPIETVDNFYLASAQTPPGTVPVMQDRFSIRIHVKVFGRNREGFDGRTLNPAIDEPASTPMPGFRATTGFGVRMITFDDMFYMGAKR